MHILSKKIGIKFLLSFFDEKSLKFVESLNLDYYKIPSPETSNLLLLSKLKKNRKKILISCGLTNKNLKYICDANPYKFNRYTPLTKIKILDHNKISKKLPDFFLVLPWHFKNNILKKDIHILKKGVKYIFPLPNIKIYTYRKNMVTSNKL